MGGRAERTKRAQRPFALSWAVYFFLGASGCAEYTEAEVLRGNRSLLRVWVEEAVDEDARAQGLRGRAPLRPDEGLLLVFPAASEVCISNAGVTFAIDVVFAEEGRITSVAQRIGANDAELRCARADEVLELSAGVGSNVLPDDELRVRFR